MYIKVLYNSKKNKKMWGREGEGWGGAILEPKTLSMYKKRITKK